METTLREMIQRFIYFETKEIYEWIVWRFLIIHTFALYQLTKVLTSYETLYIATLLRIAPFKKAIQLFDK